MLRTKSKKGRQRSGQSLVELAAGLMIGVPIILLMADCAVLMIGVATNEAVCRDAARAASAGPPSANVSGPPHSVGAGAAPYKRALSVINNVYAAGGLIKVTPALDITETLQDPIPAVAQGGPVIGTIKVETTAEVYPPFLIRAFVENGTFTFKNEQKYPYTYMMPPQSI
jgi:hypothetical protein